MPDSGTMPASDSQESADLLLQLALPRSQKVVLVIDLVESVRLMSADEAGTVARWHGFVQQAKGHTIPQHHGRLVESLDEGNNSHQIVAGRHGYAPQIFTRKAICDQI